MSGWADVRLVGDGLEVPCVDGIERRYLSLDAAASTSALPAVAARVQEFLPWYSSVHRGACWKSQLATAAYEDARAAFAGLAGRTGTDDVAIICRNTNRGDQPPRLPPRTPSRCRRGGHHRRRTPRQPAALGPRRPVPLRRVRRCRHLRGGRRRDRA